MCAPQVADVIREFKDGVREPPWCLDEDAIGGRDGWTDNVPDAGQVAARHNGKLGYRNILEIHRTKIAECPVHARTRFIDQSCRYDPRPGQLEVLVAAVFGRSINAKLAGTHHVCLIENIAAIQRILA